MRIRQLPIYAKVILLQGLFLVLHYLFEWLPCDLVSFFSGTNESLYQHMKIGFFAYILLVIVEYLLVRRDIITIDGFLYSRLFTATYFPLVMMVIYLIGPMAFVQFHNIAAEVVFANIALLLTSLSAFIVEKHIESSKTSLEFKIFVFCIFFVSLSQFIVFSTRLPWFDIFAIPPGW